VIAIEKRGDQYEVVVQTNSFSDLDLLLLPYLLVLSAIPSEPPAFAAAV